MSTRNILDADLHTIRDDILRLGSLVSRATEKAFEAFKTNDTSLAQDTINGDGEIDALHHKLEGIITETVALQQPTATDLRTLIAALLITNELERMGDHAEGIAKTVIIHKGMFNREAIPVQLNDMYRKVVVMVQRVMEAYVEDSREMAVATAEIDESIDYLYRSLFEQIVQKMGTNELPVDTGTYILWAGHALERIGDRVTNICERIIYARTGEIDGLNPKVSNLS